MTLQDLIGKTKQAYEDHGLKGLKYSVQDLLQGVLVRGGMFYNYGIDFLEEDWDVLILLDACRADLMEEVYEEYDYIESFDSRMSCASHSREWIHKTFMDEGGTSLEWLQTRLKMMRNPDHNEIYAKRFETSEFSNLAYVTWNHFSRILDEDQFFLMDEVWKYAWDDSRKAIDPRSITDRAIDTARNHDFDRMIVHYMQPHTPFRANFEDKKRSNGMDGNMNPYTKAQRGIIEKEECWNLYKDNLRWVLDDLKILLENIDAENVIISADHGNSVGEWGSYGHRPYIPLNGVKEVPWAKATASDEKTYEPELKRETADLESDTVENRLQDLGYL